MKNVLFATTASAALLIGGVASAQGITLFGDARLGLGYNINNNGSTLNKDPGDPIPGPMTTSARSPASGSAST